VRIIIELDPATGAATVSSSPTADRSAVAPDAQGAPVDAGPFSGLPAAVAAPAAAREARSVRPPIGGSPPPPHADTFGMPPNGGRRT
jgi:hypothetical protein